MPWVLDDAWNRLNGQLLPLLGPQRYGLWIRNVRPAWFDEETFAFHVESGYAREKLEALLKSAVTEAARRIANRNVKIRLAVEPESFVLPPRDLLRDETRREPAAPRAEGFETFIEGQGNRFALEVVRAFARGGPGAPRTLLLCAPSGLGKSHLLGAAAREIARLGPTPLLHFTGEQFRRHFAHAVHRGHVEGFLNKCRTVAVFLFDDVHLLADRPEPQAALEEILHALHRRGARTAVTAMKHPRRLEGLAPALKRRLRAEAEATLEPPDPATGARFLRAKAPRETPLPVLEYIAANVRSSYKDQLHCLVRLLEQGPPSPAAARTVVSEFLNQWSRGLTYADIVRAVADTFDVSVREIYSEVRSRAATDARQACFYLARRIFNDPFARIGEHIGGRDHATVLQACRKVGRRRGAVRERLKKLEESLVSFNSTSRTARLI